jgi:hypothetical protein
MARINEYPTDTNVSGSEITVVYDTDGATKNVPLQAIANLAQNLAIANIQGLEAALNDRVTDAELTAVLTAYVQAANLTVASITDAPNLWLPMFSPVLAVDLDPVQNTLTDGATIAWDMNLGRTATVTLGGNRTLANPTNIPGFGTTAVLRVVQDATGGRTLAFGTNYRWVGGVPTVNTTANSVSIISFFSDGVLMYGSLSKGWAAS